MTRSMYFNREQIDPKASKRLAHEIISMVLIKAVLL